MLNVDPPDHTRLRAWWPGPSTLPDRPARARDRAIAEDLLDELGAAGPGAVVDLVAGYAHPLPFRADRPAAGDPDEEQPALHGFFTTVLEAMGR